jgi:transposase-like protein
MRKERKQYTAEEKVAVLRRHLLDKVPVSDLCEELSLKPTVFYRWQKEFFENGAAAFQAQERPHRQVEEKQKRIEYLEKKVQTKDEVLAELMAEHVALKKTLWGTLTGSWVPHDVRDQVVDFVRRWSEKTEIGVGRFIHWLGVTASKFYNWRERYGCVNEHNGWVPRDFWLEPWEKERHAHGSAGRDPRGARPEAGAGSPAAPTATRQFSIGESLTATVIALPLPRDAKEKAAQRAALLVSFSVRRNPATV